LIKTLLVLIILFSFSAQARPENLEIWYLSSESAAKNISLFKKYQSYKSLAYSPICEEVDGKCYDPQIGIYEKIKHKKDNEEDGYVFKSRIKAKTKKSKKESSSGSLLNSGKQSENGISFKKGGIHQTNLITCDPRFYFDFYCGRARKENSKSSKAKVELWIDTSSSLNMIDVPKSGQKCNRQLFYEKVKDVCKDDLYVQKYDTSLKDISGTSDICFNYGLNNAKKFISWIEESDAKNLIIITDISEYDYKVISYLVEAGAKMKGQERGQAITALGLPNLWKEVAKKCQ
jgi:hypothetical protein